MSEREAREILRAADDCDHSACGSESDRACLGHLIAAALDARVEADAGVIEGLADQFDALASQFAGVSGIGGETMHGALTDQSCLLRNVAEAIRVAGRGSSDEPKEG